MTLAYGTFIQMIYRHSMVHMFFYARFIQGQVGVVLASSSLRPCADARPWTSCPVLVLGTCIT